MQSWVHLRRRSSDSYERRFNNGSTICWTKWSGAPGYPEQLDFTRAKVNSLAFGYGPHFCVGSALAKMEAQVGLTRLLDRVPDVELGTRQFEYRPLYFLRALKSLPIVIRR